VTAPVHLTPLTLDAAEAADWFTRFEGAGLDGIMAKPDELPYECDRRVQFKIKHRRTADCVVAGYRLHTDGRGVGSLLLGLYDGDGSLHHAGVATSFTAKARAELLALLGPDSGRAVDGSALPGSASRWNATKDLGFVPLETPRVAEVAYDAMQGDRFRHATRLVRWRDDREPRSCTYDQLEVPVPMSLTEVLEA
jgi:ATP-dependent DNA ligase